MVISQGEFWWAVLPEPVGSGPGFDRPVVVIQCDSFNRSRLATVTVIPLTSNTRLADMPGNVLLSSRKTGLPKDSIANVSGILTLDRNQLQERVGRVSRVQLESILQGLDILVAETTYSEDSSMTQPVALLTAGSGMGAGIGWRLADDGYGVSIHSDHASTITGQNLRVGGGLTRSV